MKQLAITLLIFGFSNMVYASDESIYNCPQKIVCSEVNNINSCNVVWGSYNYLRLEQGKLSSASRIESGTYEFEKAQAPYDADQNSYGHCSYRYKVNIMIAKYIFMYLTGFNATTSREGNDSWVMTAKENDGVLANCYSDDPANCPLKMNNG